MKKKLLAIIFAVLLIIIPAGTALADYYADIVLQNTSATVYPMLACNVTANNDYMANNGFFGNVDGLDTRLLLGTAEQKHMLADNRTMFALPVGAHSSQTLLFTTGSSNLTHFPVIPGYSSNVTVTDAANIELSDNFSVLVDGFIDTTAGANKSLAHKQDAFELFVPDTASGNITALIGNTALNFTGTPDKVERADTAILSAISPLTIELWIKTSDATSATQGLVNKSDGGVNKEWALAMNPTNLLRLQIYDESDGTWIGRSDTSAGINDGAWHYIYASWDGGTANTSVEIWVDNVQVDDTDAGSGIFVNIEDKAAPFQVGTSNTDANYYKGDIDEIRISDKVRSAAERTAAWNGGVRLPFTNDVNTVVLYHFNRRATAIDSSSNGLDGTITGATWVADATVSATGLTSGEYAVEAKEYPPLFFDGAGAANDIVTCGSDATIDNVWDGGGTVIIWINPASDGEGNLGHVVGKQSGGAGWRVWVEGEAASKVQLTFHFYFTGTSGYWRTTATEVTLNTWSCIVVTYNADATANIPIIYVGAASKAITAVTSPAGTRQPDATETLRIGNNDTTAYTFDGLIGATWMYDCILTPTEIQAHYDGDGYSTAGLVAHWRLDEGTGTTAYDSSINSNTGTINGATWTGVALAIYLDEQIRMMTAGVAVPNNSENWTMYQNNSLIYSDNLSFVIGNTPELWYRPTSIIEALSATTGNLTDLTNAYNHGVIHYGANPTGILLSMGGLIYTVGQPEGRITLETPGVVPEIEMPGTMYQDETAWTLTGDPIYAFVNAMSEISGAGGSQISIVLMWFMLHLIVAVIVFVVSYKPMHNLLISGSLAIVVLGYGVARTQGLIPFWVVIVLIIALLGLVVMERKTSF